MRESTTGHGVIAGLFHDAGEAEQALADLKAAGFERSEISETSGRTTDQHDTSPATPVYDQAREGTGNPLLSPFFREHESPASGFVEELLRLGFSKHDAHELVDGLVDGDALVTADAGPDIATAATILQKHYADIRYAGGVPAEAAVATDAAAATEADRVLQLRAERLQIDKRLVQHGEARIRKEVVTEMQTIDVPVTHEELVIERVAAGDDGAAEPLGAETIRVPLSGEQVNVSKRTVVREDVTIGKRRVEGVDHVDETLREEQLRVTDPTRPT